MAISLYKHKEDAWLDTSEMLEEAGKTAVIHPTGTG